MIVGGRAHAIRHIQLTMKVLEVRNYQVISVVYLKPVGFLFHQPSNICWNWNISRNAQRT